MCGEVDLFFLWFWKNDNFGSVPLPLLLSIYLTPPLFFRVLPAPIHKYVHDDDLDDLPDEHSSSPNSVPVQASAM
jgi:hypothetical protein